MTSANSAGRASRTSPAGPAATTSHPTPPVPSLRSSLSATMSWHPFWSRPAAPRMGRKLTHWTPVDRDYENLRIAMQTLFLHVGIASRRPAAA
jgi:hypothetical protein